MYALYFYDSTTVVVVLFLLLFAQSFVDDFMVHYEILYRILLLFVLVFLLLQIRAMWYLSVRNIQMDTAMSKMGIVGVYFTHGMGNIFEKISRDQHNNGTGFMGNALPYKFASVHFCFENKSFGGALQTALMMSLGKYARIRLRSHCGKFSSVQFSSSVYLFS